MTIEFFVNLKFNYFLKKKMKIENVTFLKTKIKTKMISFN